MDETFFSQPVKTNLRTYDNIRKIATGEEDDCTTGCLLDYNKCLILIRKQHSKLISLEI